MMQPPLMPGTQRPWMAALEAQLDALKIVEELMHSTHPEVMSLGSSWRVDHYLLHHGTPFAWSTDVIDAVLEASKSIPLDTMLNKWNLNTPSVWWHFEKPLPFNTIVRYPSGVGALVFGWIATKDEARFGMPCCAWHTVHSDDLKRSLGSLSPSQTWEWSKETMLGQMLDETRAHHRKLYGPGGRWSKKEHIGEEKFMVATEGLSRFILAGLAWLNQKVLVTSDGVIERHRRKAFTRATKRELRNVSIVQLRKSVSAKTDTEHHDVEWSCRWVVRGHWKNQPCGPKHGDRKLIYVLPFVKGPDDKPLNTQKTIVYEVNR